MISHPLLEYVFKQPRLATPDKIRIILLPPVINTDSIPPSYDYLASHVIPFPYNPNISSTENIKATQAIPRTSLSASSVLYRFSPRSQRSSILQSGGSSSILSLRSRSRSVNQESRPQNTINLTTLNGKHVTIGQNVVTIEQHTFNIAYDDVLYDEQDCMSDILLFLDNAAADRSDAATLQEKTTEKLAMKNCLPDAALNRQLEAVLENTQPDLELKLQRFCDTILAQDSIETIRNLMLAFLGDTPVESMIPAGDAQQHEALYDAFENHIMEQTYDVVFFKITQLTLDMDVQVSQILESMAALDPVQLGLRRSISDVRIRLTAAKDTLNRLGSRRTPVEKLDCLLDTITAISVPVDRHQADEDTGSDMDSLVSMLILTLIQSRIPHLMANITYIKEFTFERNLDIGRYGFALSTLDGALQYIFESRTHLNFISERNEQFWQAIRKGDLELTQQLYTDEMALLRDETGNTALHVAAAAGKSKIVSYLMGKMNASDRNDRGETVLMQAVYANSKETVQLILDHEQKVDPEVRNSDGNTALLLATHLHLDDIALLLLHRGCSSYAVNSNGDGILHLASKNPHLTLQLLDTLEPSMLTWQNKLGETFLHLCEHPEIINKVSCVEDSVFDVVDNKDRTPLLSWASQGRMDLVENFVSSQRKAALNNRHRIFARDKNGQTTLHLLVAAAIHADLVAPKDMSNVLQHFKELVNVRDTADGSTPLHVACKVKVTNVNRQILLEFIRKLVVECHAHLDMRNFRGKRPAHTTHDPEILALLDELALERARAELSSEMQKSIKSVWSTTRASVETAENSKSSVYYILKSWNKTTGQQTVKRRLQDFMLLRREILQEYPESFLPTLRHLVDPEQIDFRPPPSSLLEEALIRLNQFLKCLQLHPELRDHDLVRMFVRSTELKMDVIQSNASARRNLLLERIYDAYPAADGGSSGGDEEYFFSFAQNSVISLKNSFRAAVHAGLKLEQCQQGLSRELCHVAQGYQATAHCLVGDDAAFGMISICIALTGDTGFGISPWQDLVHGFQGIQDLTDGILMALQRPFWLLQQSADLRAQLEQERDSLRRAKNWNEIFSTQEQRQRIEESKSRVVKTLEQVARAGSEIRQSHQMVSDEMAHFQRVHPNQVIKMIRKMAGEQLERERLTLQWLHHARRCCRGAAF